MSCDRLHDNKDYPKKVTFSEYGGEKVIRGSECVRFISIDNGSEETIYSIIEDKSIEATVDWLTVKASWPENSLTLIAAPKSEVDGPEEIYLGLNFGREFGNMKVVRK